MEKIDIEARLKELGIVVPDMTLPLANYVPAKRTGNLVFTSVQAGFSQSHF